LDDTVFENYSITKLWFYKLKRHKTEKRVMSGVSETPKDYSFDKIMVLDTIQDLLHPKHTITFKNQSIL
jgi:hypothetical protein